MADILGSAAAWRCFTFVLSLSFISDRLTGAPVGRFSNVTRSEIKNTDLLPPDHIAGGHMEHDGDINKDFHHEAFLGTLVKQGKLKFDNMDGYRKLIKIFHRVDKNNDHLVSKIELQDWIHDRILEHYEAAKEDSDKVFKKVDLDGDNNITWADYKAQLVGMDPKKFKDGNVTLESDLTGEFSKEVKHWIKADFNEDRTLDSIEFLSFLHPEHNKRTLHNMAVEMMPSFDTDKDQQISLEEFTALPPGQVDPDEADLDKEFIEERTNEFKNDMDADSDGFVTLDELVHYLDPRHIQHAIKEAQYLIRVADRNRDQKLSEHEVLLNYALFTGSSLTNYAAVLHDEF